MGTIKTGLLLAVATIALAGCGGTKEPEANNAADNAMNDAGANLTAASANASNAAENLAASTNASNAQDNESDPNANPIKP